MSNNIKQAAKNSDKSALKLLSRLFPYIKTNSGGIAVMYFFSLANVAATIALPFLIQKGIDYGIAPKNIDYLIKISVITAVVLTLQFFSFRYQGKLMMKIGNVILYSIRRDLFNHIQRLSFRFFDKNKTGNIMTRLTVDVQVLEELLMTGLDTVLVDVIMIVGIIGAMLLLDLKLSLVLLFVLPLLVMIVFGLQSKIVRAARGIQGRLSSVNAFLNESLSGVMVTRSFAREERNIQLFENYNRSYYQNTRRFYPLHAYFWQSVIMLNTASTGLVIIGGGLLIKNGQVTLGVVAAFLTYVTQLFQPMQKISNMLNQLSRAYASCERIFAVLDEKPDIVEVDDALKDFKLTGDVSFRDVKFHYNPEEPILKGISFDAKAGETVAIVGHTGSGKSTIVHLISRFYDVTDGAVLIGSRDIRNYGIAEYRRQTAVVMQEPQIFSGSVYDNISFSVPGATHDEVISVCKVLGIHDMITGFPQGYDTPMGERGANISIGQKQLLAFARAMLRNPRILILDEASAYLDTRTETMVQAALSKIMEGRTTFVIAHRLSTIRNADTIYVLDQGNIAESGTHAQLVNRNGIYMSFLKQNLPGFDSDSD
ncbi:MAG: ABC transporter ATP-binding protein [Spirochaetes bacterium]|jgi:ABC-type multidrug transport system fused ATPase/permease subunit|nr:ABC transporter ATP-binding protein [Spirochaetota bacterium]